MPSGMGKRNEGKSMPKKILLVDDEPLILKGLKYSLEQDGYQTDLAMDGEEALTKFFAGRYDLILLDVMLPGVDGMEVCPVSYTHLLAGRHDDQL